MAAATTYVDKILTVSPTYAWELINLPEMGVNLDEIFTAKGVTGIVNGVKETVDPANPSFAMQSKMLSPQPMHGSSSIYRRWGSISTRFSRRRVSLVSLMV